MQLVVRSLLFLIIASSMAVANAAQLTDSSALQDMEHELHKKPWETYQTILLQVDQQENMSPHYRLWWLLRKAQTENLLYFFDKFENTINEAIASVSQQTPARIIINIDIYRGLILQRKGLYQLSQTVLKKAKQSALDNKFTYLAVQAKQELAYTRSLTEVYELSLTELQQSYVEAFALNDDFLIARINEVYGAVYGYMNDFDKSIEYYLKALASYQKLEYPAHEAEALYGLAATYRYWKKYDVAIDYYQRFQQKVEFSPNNIDGKFLGAYGLAMTEAEQGNCVKALKSIEYALNIEGLIDYKAELYKRKTQCLISSKKLEEATQALKKSNDILKTIPELTDTRWQIENIKISAELAYAKGNSQEAYILLQQFNQKEIELIKSNMSDRLILVRGALESERQNIEISLLQQRSKIQSLQVEQQQHENTLQSYVIGLVVLLVFFMLFFAYFQWSHSKKLLRLSVRDPLSNSYNRRYVFNFLHKVVDENKSDKKTVSIMVIDIDDFKKVNDRYGHPFGDEVIRIVAEIGADTLRTEDVIGRVGGEEFLCVLPRIDAIQSLHIAQRLVKKVNEHAFFAEVEDGKARNVNITISIGLATTTSSDQTSAELYEQADKALYQAKYNGKNRAIQYQDSIDYSNKRKTVPKLQTLSLDDE